MVLKSIFWDTHSIYMNFYILESFCICTYLSATVCTCLYMCLMFCTSPYLYLHVSTCINICLSVCFWTSFFTCLHLSVPVCTCLYRFLLFCTCPNVSVSSFLYMYVNVCNFLYHYLPVLPNFICLYQSVYFHIRQYLVPEGRSGLKPPFPEAWIWQLL